MDYKPVIGLEVHLQLRTESKLFCACRAQYLGLPPNSNVCPTCLGLPGALPMAPSRKAIDDTLLLGLALNCRINEFSRFDRKHYFYPDLPKGYQISQYGQPIAIQGLFKFNVFGQEKEVHIRRVHLEEDTGKLLHGHQLGEKGDYSLIDFNRSGVPLVEIVTEPDLHSSEEVVVFLKMLQEIIRDLQISDADMEKGSLRLEPNVSVWKCKAQSAKRKTEFGLPPYKVELKNINSFRFVKKALDYEIERQTEELKARRKLAAETRGFSEKTGQTVLQRSKEEAHDYRYFPEPDLPPMVFAREWVEEIKRRLPEVRADRTARLTKDYGLTENQAQALLRDASRLALFEETIFELKKSSYGFSPVEVANWLINRPQLTSGLSASAFLQKMAEAKKTTVVAAERLEEMISQVIRENPKAVADYKGGKVGVLQFLLGKTLFALGGKVEVEKVKQRLLKDLSA